MKKNFRILGTALMCALMATGISSCGNDEPSSDAVIVIPGDTDENGKPVGDQRLSSLGSYNVEYTADGAVKSVSNSRFKYVINGNKLECYEYDDLEQSYDMKWTSEGYISQLAISISVKDDGVSGKFSTTMDFSYDGSGHLTKWNNKISASGTEEGEKFSYELNANFSASWNGNLLSSYKLNCKESAKYGKDEESSQTDYNGKYTYGTQENKYCQMPVALSKPIFASIDEEFYNICAAVGLFGKGPEKLPTTLEGEVTQGSGSASPFTQQCSYTLSSNGAIVKEVFAGKTYNWIYGEIATKAMDNVDASSAKPKIFMDKSMFLKAKKTAK